MIIGAALLTGATLVISFWPSGSVESRLQKDFEKENNIESPSPDVLASSDSGDTTPISPPAALPVEPVATEKIHVVAEDETLSDIAEHYFNNPMMINRIVDANPDVIPETNFLTEGMRLVIPK